MVSRSEGFRVLYPVYFDARRARADGRRVPAALAVNSPNAREVFEAAKAAGLAPVLEDEHHHPSQWFERGGRVLVPKGQAKTKRALLLKVAPALQKVAAARSEAPTGKHPHHGKGRFVKKKRRRGRR